MGSQRRKQSSLALLVTNGPMNMQNTSSDKNGQHTICYLKHLPSYLRGCENACFPAVRERAAHAMGRSFLEKTDVQQAPAAGRVCMNDGLSGIEAIHQFETSV